MQDGNINAPVESEINTKTNNNNIENYQILEVDNQDHIQEKVITPKNGWCMLCFFIGMFLAGVGLMVLLILTCPYALPIPCLMIIFSFVFCCGFFTNPPNTAAVMMFCGKYVGTVVDNGFFFINPFYSPQHISLKSETLNSPIVKVNDKTGNPILVGCVVIWRVNECNKALFDVENYRSFITNQCENAVRHVGCIFPYDKVGDDDVCLRSGHEIVHQTLKDELGRRLQKAGIIVEDARITELSYSTEIANVMLKRQSAEAIVSAREKIVRGAVDIVQNAVIEMESKNICKLDEDDKAKMVENLMVVLCSDTQQGNNA